MKRELLATGALLLATACGNSTAGGGAYANGCLNHDATFYLRASGESFEVGVEDMSFSNGQAGDDATDIVKIERNGGDLNFESAGDDSSILVNGTEAPLGDTFRLAITNNEQRGVLREEGQEVEFTVNLDEDGTAIVALEWFCKNK